MDPEKGCSSENRDAAINQEKRLAEMSSTATFPSQCETLIAEETATESKDSDTATKAVTPKAPMTPAPAALPIIKQEKPSPFTVKPENKTAFKHFWVKSPECNYTT